MNSLMNPSTNNSSQNKSFSFSVFLQDGTCAPGIRKAFLKTIIPTYDEMMGGFLKLSKEGPIYRIHLTESSLNPYELVGKPCIASFQEHEEKEKANSFHVVLKPFIDKRKKEL